MLKSGASVVGQIVKEGGAALSTGCRVRLLPERAERSETPQSRERQDPLELEGVVHHGGFFEISGVPTGNYFLRAEEAEWVSAELPHVHVQPHDVS